MAVRAAWRQPDMRVSCTHTSDAPCTPLQQGITYCERASGACERVPSDLVHDEGILRPPAVQRAKVGGDVGERDKVAGDR